MDEKRVFYVVDKKTGKKLDDDFMIDPFGELYSTSFEFELEVSDCDYGTVIFTNEKPEVSALKAENARLRSALDEVPAAFVEAMVVKDHEGNIRGFFGHENQ